MENDFTDEELVSFLRTMGLLVRQVRSAVSSNDLTLTQNSVLSRLAKEGPATTSDLARAERIKPQSMGTAVGELEALGLVDRRPHPTDGRQALIGLTDRGLALRKASTEEKKTWLAEAVAQLSPDERATLRTAAKILVKMVER